MRQILPQCCILVRVVWFKEGVNVDQCQGLPASTAFSAGMDVACDASFSSFVLHGTRMIPCVLLVPIP